MCVCVCVCVCLFVLIVSSMHPLFPNCVCLGLNVCVCVCVCGAGGVCVCALFFINFLFHKCVCGWVCVWAQAHMRVFYIQFHMRCLSYKHVYEDEYVCKFPSVCNISWLLCFLK